MSIDFDDISIMSSDEILELLDRKRRTAAKQSKENAELESAFESIRPRVENVVEKIEIDEEEEIESQEVDFEKDVKEYLEDFKKLDNYSRKSIEAILPSYDDYNYEKILMRLMAEVTRSIKNEKEFLMALGSDMTVLELKELKDKIVSLNEIRCTLKDILFEEIDENKLEKTKNKLIFVPIKNGGKVRIFDELKDIPEEMYEGFIELFDSIKDGTFRNCRKFYNNENLKNAYEVKGHQIRVVYQRLSKDCYAIISMFIKKTQNDNGYRRTLELKYGEYLSMENELREKTKDPAFILKNQEYEDELYSILSRNKGDIK